MTNTDNPIAPLPEEFQSEKESGKFWDTHSLTDYEQLLEPVELEVDIVCRHFEIEVDEESFLALQDSARKQHKPIKQIASEILKQRLRAS